jgi:transcriptional regulator with XRE-family HTH domain
MRDVGLRISQARSKRGLTQQALADRIGRSLRQPNSNLSSRKLYQPIYHVEISCYYEKGRTEATGERGNQACISKGLQRVSAMDSDAGMAHGC